MGRIVVGVDGSAHADRALRWAIREAELHGAELELVYAYVIHPRASFGAPDRERAYVAMEELVRRHRSLLEGAEKWITTVVPILVGPAGALIEAGEDPDLITAGSRGLGGFGELAVGATSYRTAAHPSAPVAVIRGGDETASPDGSRPIVVGVDGSRAGGRALRWALDEAALRGVGVAAVHAYMEWTNLGQTTLMTAAQSERLRRQVHDEAVAIVDRALAEVEIPDGVALERVATRGPPAAVLLDEAGGGPAACPRIPRTRRAGPDGIRVRQPPELASGSRIRSWWCPEPSGEQEHVMKTMHAKVGDRLVIRRHHVGEPDRDGEILEVRGEDGLPPYVIRWSDDGHVSWFIPGSDAFVQHLGDDTGEAR